MKRTAAHHGWQLPERETLVSLPSFITLTRTLMSVGFAIFAAVSMSMPWLIAAIVVYWIGDIADGLVARFTGRETRSGAIFDIMADRLCVALIYLIFGFWHQDVLIAIGLYLVEFIFIDGFLSLAFLFWPLLSPNYFYLVDRRVYNLNWSPVGKAANSGVFLLATIAFQNVYLSSAIAIIILGVKIYSIGRLYKTIGISSSHAS